MTITYFKGGEGIDSDALPSWEATVESNGEHPDLENDFTFKLVQTPRTGEQVVKTTGFTPGPDGLVTVEWAPGELDDMPLGTTRLALVAIRDADQKPFTAREWLYIRQR